MSDNVTAPGNPSGATPAAMLPPTTSTDSARDIAATLVRDGGADIAAINAKLQSRGAQPLNANSAEMAQLAKARLFGNSDFKERYAKGDTAAMQEFNAVAARMLQAKGNLLDAPASPADYNFTPALHAAGEAYSEPGQFTESLREWSHGLSLPQNVASAIAADHISFVERGSRLAPEEATALGDNEARMFAKTLGETTDAQIKEASATLTRKLGRTIDLAQVVRSNGATVALRLLWHAQDLQARGQ